MNKKFGLFILLGLVIGSMFGLPLGAANGNPIWGLGLGALVGVFLGWFIAAVVLENQNSKKNK